MYLLLKHTLKLSSSFMEYPRSVSSYPPTDMRMSYSPPGAEGSGVCRHVCISAFPASEVIIGCSLGVANVYTCPVSEATSSITWVPVRVLNSYAYNKKDNNYYKVSKFFFRIT